MHFLEKLKDLKQNSFSRSVGILIGGTAFAQLLMIIVLPLLTRIYGPNDFSILAVYTALVTILSVAAGLRFDIAIPLPDNDEEAINILALALFFSSIVTILIAIPITLFPNIISEALKQPGIEPYLFLVPVGIFITSSYNALQFWATRKKKFLLISKTRMSQAIFGIATQLSLGVMGLIPLGLILGQLVTSGAGLVGLTREVVNDKTQILKRINVASMILNFKTYSRFPKYSSFEALTNSAGIQLPLIAIAALAVGAEAGFLMLAMRVMQAPLGLIGSAASQVYLSRAAEEDRQGTLGEFTEKTLIGLIKIGIIPLVLACFTAPAAFAILFGDEWRRAGSLVSWMTPWLIIQLLASPISMVMHVKGRQLAMLVLTTIGLLARLGAVIMAAMWAPGFLSETYAIASAGFYAICLTLFCATAGLGSASCGRMALVFGKLLVFSIAIAIPVQILLENIGY